MIEQIMTVILQHRLSADQATTLLGQTIQLVEWGKPSAPGTIHLPATTVHAISHISLFD